MPSKCLIKCPRERLSILSFQKMAIARVLFRQALLVHSDHLLAIRSTHQARSPFKVFFSVSSSSGNGDDGYCRRSNNYLKLSDEELMAQCEMDTYKASGPGGQHRNKRESAVRLKHLPTGVIAQVPFLHIDVYIYIYCRKKIVFLQLVEAIYY